MSVSSLPCLTSYTWDLRAPVESILKDLPALFCPPVPEDCFQGVLLTDSLKSWNLAFLKFRVLTTVLTFPISLRSVNSTSAAQAASSLDVTNELICIGEYQVQYCIP